MPYNSSSSLIRRARKVVSRNYDRLLLAARLLVAIVLILGISIVARDLWQKKHSALTANSGITKSSPEFPLFLSFSDHYYFTVPANYVINAAAIPGVQLIFLNGLPVQGKKLEEVYNLGAIAVQPITDLTDQSAAGLKSYVEQTIIPGQKVNGDDISATYGTKGKLNTATVTVKKKGILVHSLYLQTGLHPVIVVAQQNDPPFKKVTSSLSDIESSSLESENADLQSTLSSFIRLMQNAQTADLYTQSTADLQSKNTQAQFDATLHSAQAYLKRSIVIPGGSFTADEFSAPIYFTPSTKDEKLISGLIDLKKENGHWKLQGLDLPTQ